jgi:hypothetical protein
MAYSDSMQPFKIAIAGAAGVWADHCHAPAINELFMAGFPVRVVAVAELGDPFFSTAAREHIRARQMIEMHRPSLIDASRGVREALADLDTVHAREGVDLLIVCTDPVAHFPYCRWAASNAVSFLCDKPITLVDKCSSQLAAASAISKQFDSLLSLIQSARAKNSRFRAATLLRRRSLAPFLLAAQEITSVYQATGSPVRSMNVGTSVGVHFTPDEYLSPGAHGFLDGCGSLSFSSYHYLDVIAWFLSLAPGSASHVRVECPYVLRVADCLATNVSSPLFLLLGAQAESGVTRDLPDHVAAAELDFFVTMRLLDDEEQPLGLITYSYNRTSYTARKIRPNQNIVNPGAHPDGGRMSQFLIDLHQGPCQSIRLLKNDAVFGSQRIRYERWAHPMLGADAYEERLFEDAYEGNLITPKGLVQDFIRLLSGTVTEADLAIVPSPVESQQLTHRIYAACYEILAEDAEARHGNSTKDGECRSARTVDLV